MEKKRKLKVIVPLQKKQKEAKEDKENNLENLVFEPQTRPEQNRISPSLELSEATLETQIANVKETKNDDSNQTQVQAYESIKYTANQSDYQGSAYQTANQNLTPSFSPSSLNSSQQDFMKNPMGFRPVGSFEQTNYPKNPEKNYESSNPQNDKRRRQ